MWTAPETEDFAVADLLHRAAARLGVLACNASYADLHSEMLSFNVLTVFKAMALTTGNRAPQIKMREKDKMRPIFAEMFSLNISVHT